MQGLCLLLQRDPQNYPEPLWRQAGGVLLKRVHVSLHRSLLRGQRQIQKCSRLEKRRLVLKMCLYHINPVKKKGEQMKTFRKRTTNIEMLQCER